ncbi:MAG: hypothetical protein OHK006_11360 [Thermodesulfovibrionales bacterium]
MPAFISVVIPVRNGARTIAACLDAVLASSYERFEVIVVDDGSADATAEIASRFPCRLVRLEGRSGASAARNAGGREASGEILFFIDADCMVLPDTLRMVDRSMAADRSVVIGGSYTPLPFDPGFFNEFQSLFINYSELKSPVPDYVASHAMAIGRAEFLASSGFPEDFMPILEDVEFSHRLRRSGRTLRMEPSILVRHSFGFGLKESLSNAFRKSCYWTAYSIVNRDLLRDSGTASVELKADVVCFGLSAAAAAASVLAGRELLLAAFLVQVANLWTSRRLIAAFLRHRGTAFGLAATLYYALVYAPAVGLGGLAGVLHHVSCTKEAVSE